MTLQREQLHQVLITASESTAGGTLDHCIDHLVDIVHFSSRVLKSPEHTTPPLRPRTWAPNRQNACDLAVKTRRGLHLDGTEPALDIPARLDCYLDVLVFPFSLKEGRTVGIVADKRQFIFVNEQPATDALFLCGHALVHTFALLDKYKGPTAVICDSLAKPQAHKHPKERFADLFSYELLMPLRGVGLAIRHIRKLLNVSSDAIGDVELIYLSRIFGVSFLRAATWCEKLGLLPAGGAMSLNDFINIRYGGAESRAEHLDLSPRPDVHLDDIPNSLLRAALKEVERGLMHREQLSRLFSTDKERLLRDKGEIH